MTTKLRDWAFLAPAAILYGGVFVAPLLFFLVISFWDMRLFRMVAAFSLQNYGEAVREFGGSLAFTLMVGASVASICVVLAVAIGWVIRFRSRSRIGEVMLLAVMITLFGGYLMKIYAWKTILGNEGVINSALRSLGLIDEPLPGLLYSRGAVVVTLVHFLLPFAVLPIYGALRSIRDVELEAARDLGARPSAAFLTVVLPRCRFGIVVAFAICFLLAIGDYITPVLVGGGSSNLFGQMIAPQFGTMFDWPLGSAMAFSLLSAAAVVVAAVTGLINWVTRP